MQTIRLTLAQAIVRFLMAQKIDDDGQTLPLFAGVHAIFGHGNVTCLGSALEKVQDQLPTYRGQNEQSMALAAVAYARARRRKQIHVCSASVGPGSANMVTAAGVAMSDRLPVLFLCGDSFATRFPDPVLQQVEHFHDLTITTNDAFKAVSAFFDRIVRPEQILYSLPQAVALMLDPAACGPATFSLAQDTQGEAFGYPVDFFKERTHRIPRYPAADDQLDEAAAIIRSAQRPLIIAGGGVHYSGACQELADFSTRFAIPVAETIMGRSALVHEHRLNLASLGVMGGDAGNALAAEADVVVSIGTRLADMITGSWTVFRDPSVRFVSLNANRFDANKHMAHPVVGDAQALLADTDGTLRDLVGAKGVGRQGRGRQNRLGRGRRSADSTHQPGAAELSAGDRRGAAPSPTNGRDPVRGRWLAWRTLLRLEISGRRYVRIRVRLLVYGL